MTPPPTTATSPCDAAFPDNPFPSTVRSLRRYDPDQVRRSGLQPPLSPVPAGLPCGPESTVPIGARHVSMSGGPHRSDYPVNMPGLDGIGIRTRLAEARLYLCTDARTERGDLADFADAALSGGVDIIQLRDKSAAGAPLDARHELTALEVLAQACVRHDALLAVNDRADIALAVEADVLHLGQDDLPVDIARRVVGEHVAIGRSTHDVVQADAAATEPGADYFCTGPVWTTPTKPGRPAAGLDLVRHAAEHRGHGRPWFAIGGIGEDTIDDVLRAGAQRIVVVRAITDAEDPRAAARTLRSRLDEARR